MICICISANIHSWLFLFPWEVDIVLFPTLMVMFFVTYLVFFLLAQQKYIDSLIIYLWQKCLVTLFLSYLFGCNLKVIFDIWGYQGLLHIHLYMWCISNTTYSFIIWNEFLGAFKMESYNTVVLGLKIEKQYCAYNKSIYKSIFYPTTLYLGAMHKCNVSVVQIKTQIYKYRR